VLPLIADLIFLEGYRIEAAPSIEIPLNHFQVVQAEQNFSTTTIDGSSKFWVDG
jgi:hypothetical protein